MPERQEVLYSLYGAWRLAFLDQSGMRFFNLSVEGFWRSFFAAVLVAPGYALLVAQKLSARPGSFDLGWAALVQIVAYALSWAAFPLAALALTQLLGLSRNYVPLVIALNWGSVLQLMLLLAAIVLGLALPVVGSLLPLLATGAALFYQWFVTRAALETSGGIALLLVLVDLVLNAAIHLSAGRLI